VNDTYRTLYRAMLKNGKLRIFAEQPAEDCRYDSNKKSSFESPENLNGQKRRLHLTLLRQQIDQVTSK